MRISSTSLPDVKLIERRIHRDERGYFQEIYHQQTFEALGIHVRFVQDNMSRSCKGTLRGLHYQIQQSQGRLVQVFSGSVFDVAVDLRRSSPTFGQWTGVVLDEDQAESLYIPPGFAHGFYVLSDVADLFYKCTDFYAPEHERTLLWNDSEVGIDWPLEGHPLLSAKDQRGGRLHEVEEIAVG